MTIVFFSNLLNHHQVALCDELYRQNDGQFYFVEIASSSLAFQSKGAQCFDRSYLIRNSEGEQSIRKAKELALSADVAIMGAQSWDFLKLRINAGQGITFSYSERWLKHGWLNFFSPNLLKLIKLYISKGRKRQWYMLAASGYLANDLKRIGIFKNRIFKWGYFPQYSLSPSQKAFERTTKILWVGRFIDWKRPEIMIALARKLIVLNYDFQITMIGSGDMSYNIEKEIKSDPLLGEHIELRGNIPNTEVVKTMSNNDIFCFTSTRREGWGAVLGEAMAAGCCPVASIDAGATPFLVKDGVNGLIFQTNNFQDFYDKIKYLIDNPAERQRMSKEAKRTMMTKWNSETAAREFIALAKLKLADPTKLTLESDLPASPVQ